MNQLGTPPAHPYLLSDAVLRCAWVTADPEQLTALCIAHFDVPTRGRVQVRPVGSGVAVVLADIGELRAPGGESAAEREIGCWIPVEVRVDGGPPQRAWHLPWLLVDHAGAVVAGREGFGYPKMHAELEWGEDLVRACLPDSSEPVFELRTEPSGSPLRGALAVARHLGGERLDSLPGLVRDLLVDREVPVVLLRQLRDVERPGRAAHTEVVRVVHRLRRVGSVRMRGVTGTVNLSDDASLPLGPRVGLRGSVPLDGLVEAHVDFDLASATSLWSSPVGERVRIAVLGAGMGSLSAVFDLLDRPGAPEHYEITVYSSGHRPGGKCASGRLEDGRIVEHGLHVLFGCYQSSFDLIRRLYAAWGEREWTEVFTRQRMFELWDRREGDWHRWRLDFPDNPRVPGTPIPTDPASLARQLGRWLRTSVHMWLLPPEHRTGIGRAGSVLAANLARGWILGVGKLVDRALAGRPDGRLARRLRRELGRLSESWILRDEGAWETYVILDLALAALTGIAADRVVERGFDWLDQFDLREWLRRHGASETSLGAAPIRVIYDMLFAYEQGDRARPALSAAGGLEAILGMLFTYSGSFAWKMNGGMGDVVFTPLYDVLRARGVRFRFFSDVVELIPGEHGAIEAIELRDRTPPDFEALVPIGELRCWPEEPIHNGEGAGRPVRLVLGEHFDHVLLGIPAPTQPSVVARLAEQRPEWRTMLDSVGTVSTAAAQVWLEEPHEDLSGNPGSAILGGFEGPFDTWADMSHTLAHEGWDTAPGTVLYGCGPWPDSAGEPPEGELARALDDYLEQHARELWPAASSHTVRATAVRVNTRGSDRYIQSLPGTRALRLAPDGSGYDNLWLAGDWTKSRFALGCLETTVCSGLDAARAIAEATG